MVRSRRYRRRGRRLRRRYRRPRRVFRRRLRRRRMLRRRGFGALTVGVHKDYMLTQSSFIPSSTLVNGTSVGVPPDGFATWSIGILPPELQAVPGDLTVSGSWSQKQTDLYKRQIGLGTSTAGTGDSLMLTDLPNCIDNYTVYNYCNCKGIWDLCTHYRIAWIAVSFTVPENTDGEKNHHLYLEWCNLPLAQSCANWDDVDGIITPPHASSNKNGFNSFGWNWLCKPADVAEAASIPGYQSLRHHWHRAQLSFSSPVTIRWRPRHSAIQVDSTQYVDQTLTTNGQVQYITANFEYFSKKRRLVRSYLPCEFPVKPKTGSSLQNGQWWLGPLVRLVDSDLPHLSATGSSAGNLFSSYGIRCSMTMKLKLKGLKGADKLFPEYQPKRVVTG